jgi:acyl-coenzyme A thioesterase PaaI-like protein
MDAAPERLPLTHLGEGLRCFVCRPRDQAGLGLTFDLLGDHVEAPWLPQEAYEGWPGVLHGGAIAAVLDEGAAWAMIGIEGQVGFTTRMDIRFHKPVPLAKEATVVGRVLGLQGRGGRFASEVRLASGELAASAEVEYVFVDDKMVERVLGRAVPGRLGEWLRAPPPERKALTLRWSREWARQRAP